VPWLPPTLLHLAEFVEPRGTLVAAEAPQLPFQVHRYFVICGVPPGEVRGGHSHLYGHELLSCLAGRCSVQVRSPGGEQCFVLDDRAIALHVPPRNWVECFDFSEDALLVVLCSHVYEPSKTVREPPQRPSGP
jgi:UDP-2-acetamido-3-amino-2,3-dideoxy-glucuronate N-acetyltransferase